MRENVKELKGRLDAMEEERSQGSAPSTPPGSRMGNPLEYTFVYSTFTDDSEDRVSQYLSYTERQRKLVN